jgi:sulfate permease, SulP family
MLMLIVILVAPYAMYLPKAAMAGILFLVAWGLIDFKEILHILQSSKRESTVLLVTLLSAMFLELEFAIFAGVLLSLVLYLEMVSKPNIVTRVPDPRLYKHAFSSDPALPECKQLKIVRIEGSLFFGCVSHLQDTFDRFRKWYPAQKHLAIIADTISFIDLQASYALVEEAKRREADGGKLYLINIKDGIWDSLELSGALDKIGTRNIFQSKQAAVHAMCHKLDREICLGCQDRIFEECKDKISG